MHRNFLIAIVAVVGAIVFEFCCAEPTNSLLQVRLSQQASGDFDALFDSLASPIPEGELGKAELQAIARQREKQREAEAKLRTLGTNVLPQLMQKVLTVGQEEATNLFAAQIDAMRVVRAFSVLGDKASPLLPKLINELRCGRSIGPSIAGLTYIGGTQAGLALVPELTNSDPTIQRWAMSALLNFNTNDIVIAASAPLVLNHLHDDSAFSKILAADVLGQFKVNADTVLPALAQLAEYDQDVVVRFAAIRAIGRFGTNAAPVKATLKKIAATTEEERIRSVCLQALRAIN